MKSTAKKLVVCAAALCLLACGTAVSAAAASPVSGLALSGVAMPWDQDVPAESIEAGSYTANMLLGSSQQLSPVVRPRNSTDSVVFISDDTSIDREQLRCRAGCGRRHHPHHRCRRQQDLCLHHRCLHGFFHDRYRDGPFPLSTPSMLATRSRHSCRCGLLRLPTMPPSPRPLPMRRSPR